MKLWEAKWIVIDTETTGLDIQTAGICEIAARYFKDGEIVPPKLGLLVNPGHPIPEAATAVHGITDAMVANAPRMEAVLPNLIRRIEEADVIVAYNGYGYDIPLLDIIAQRAGMADEWESRLRPKPFIDPYIMVREIAAVGRWRGPGTRKLTSVCERFGITVDGPAHRAGADCEMTGKVLCHICEACSFDWLGLHIYEMEAELRRMKDRQDKEFEAWKASRA